MPTTISVEEYLASAYSPDVDYVDGRLEDRHVVTATHGKLRWHMKFLLGKHKLAAFITVRLRTTATRYRVPDVCAYLTEPDEEVFTGAPLLCVEVLSPDDLWDRVMDLADEYLEMGVPAVWFLDPIRKQAYVVDAKSRALQAVRGTLSTLDGPVSLTLDEIFAVV